MNLYRVDDKPLFDGKCALYGGYFYVETMLTNSLNKGIVVGSCVIPKGDVLNSEDWCCCDIASEASKFSKDAFEDDFVADILPVIVGPHSTRRMIFQWKVPEDWVPLFGRYGDEEVFRIRIESGEHRLYFYGRFEYVNGEKWMQERLGQVRRRAHRDDKERYSTKSHGSN